MKNLRELNDYEITQISGGKGILGNGGALGDLSTDLLETVNGIVTHLGGNGGILSTITTVNGGVGYIIGGEIPAGS